MGAPSAARPASAWPPPSPAYTGPRRPLSCSRAPTTWRTLARNCCTTLPPGRCLRSLGHLPWMLDLGPYDEHVRAMATAFLGPLRGKNRLPFTIREKENDKKLALLGK